MPPLETDTKNTGSAASAPTEPAPAATVTAPVVIRAKAGEPWPEPPHGGSWSRNPKTGDLTLVEPPTKPADPSKE